MIRRPVEFRCALVDGFGFGFELGFGSGRRADRPGAEGVKRLRGSRTRVEWEGGWRRRREVGIDGGGRRGGRVVMAINAALSSELETTESRFDPVPTPVVGGNDVDGVLGGRSEDVEDGLEPAV